MAKEIFRMNDILKSHNKEACEVNTVSYTL